MVFCLKCLDFEVLSKSCMMLNIQNGRSIISVASIMKDLQVEWRKKVRFPFLNVLYKNTISDTKHTLEMAARLHIPLSLNKTYVVILFSQRTSAPATCKKRVKKKYVDTTVEKEGETYVAGGF